MSKLTSALVGLAGERIALCGVSVNAMLQDLFSEVSVTQTYRNDESGPIEAVYTFALPVDAVLLEMEVEIGQRRLQGQVVEKKAAEEAYEDAMADGDAAVMLEAIEPGLYTMNVGNLRPGETAKVTISYALLHRWAGSRLRFFVPTTIAPRYGSSPHAPHQQPEAALTVEHQFDLQLKVVGALMEAQFACPSHRVKLAKSPESLLISLRESKVAMDRDFVVDITAPLAARSSMVTGQDDDGLAAVASFQPFFAGLRQQRPMSFAIVVDCSGSMKGDSMAQAKQAILSVLETLREEDRVALVAFGNSTKVFADGLTRCTKPSVTKARRFASSLDADMGGTEIGEALSVAHSLLRESGDILLITDGEVAEWQPVVEAAKAAGHRIFSVGVGSAVSEAFVRGLAIATGGGCELVSPREDMAQRVVRHFERMRAPRAVRATIHWPSEPSEVAPSDTGPVFDGDTVVAYARFDRAKVQGSVVLEVQDEDGQVLRQELTLPADRPQSELSSVSTVARMVAAARLKTSAAEAGLETAMKYRLASPWTNWLVVAPRPEGEKAQGMPALRRVPQTLAAGWGGTGVVAAVADSVFPRQAFHSLQLSEAMSPLRHRAQPKAPSQSGLPAGLRRLLELIEEDESRLSTSGAMELLQQANCPGQLHEIVRGADELGLSTEAVAAMVLARLLDGPLRKFLSEEANRRLERLQGFANEAGAALRDLAATSMAFGRAFHRSMACGALRHTTSIRELEQFASIASFLDHIDDVARRA